MLWIGDCIAYGALAVCVILTIVSIMRFMLFVIMGITTDDDNARRAAVFVLGVIMIVMSTLWFIFSDGQKDNKSKTTITAEAADE